MHTSQFLSNLVSFFQTLSFQRDNIPTLNIEIVLRNVHFHPPTVPWTTKLMKGFIIESK